MAIGSAPEIGVTFRRFGDMTCDEQRAWFAHIRTAYGPDLLGGYATIHYPDRTRYQRTDDHRPRPLRPAYPATD